VSLFVLLLGGVALAALTAGFIPARLEGLAIPPGHGFVVPTWATPLSAALLHGGPGHLFFNMLILFVVGAATEQAVGGRALLLLYVVGAYAAAAGQWVLGPATGPMIGASGAVSAVVAAYALLYGRNRARPIGPVPAELVHVAWLAAAWIAIQALVGIAGLGGGVPIAIGAHIGGFIAGLGLARPLLLWRYRRA
jgi:membrane associated rhomboid family serine protease